MPTHGVGGQQERCGKAETGAPMSTRKLCEEREFFKNIRFEVLESAGIEYGKSLLLISFPNRNRELYAGSSHLPIGSGTNKLWWEQLYSHLLVLRNTRRPGRRTVSFQTSWTSFHASKHTHSQTDQIKPGQGGCVVRLSTICQLKEPFQAGH